MPLSVPSHSSFFLIGRELLYNIVLVSAIYQHESVIGTHMSPPSWTSLPPPTPSHPSRLLQSLSLSFLSHTANSHWLFYTWQCICFYVILSIRPTLSFFPRHPTTISLSIHLLMGVWTVCTFWYIVNNAAVNMSIKVSVLNTCFQFFGHILRIKLMDLMVILCLPFWGNH